MAMKQTQEKLRQWGMWLRGGTGLGYGGNVLAEMRGGGLPTAPISDERALKIDRVVAILKITNYLQYLCIKRSYESGLSVRAIGRELKISHQTVQRKIESGEHWLDVAFDVEKV